MGTAAGLIGTTAFQGLAVSGLLGVSGPPCRSAPLGGSGPTLRRAPLARQAFEAGSGSRAAWSSRVWPDLCDHREDPA
jgi:hypothetical protein